MFLLDVGFLFQTVIAQINHAIGAEGVVSAECKEVVSQYGEMIWDLLVSEVKCFWQFYAYHCIIKHYSDVYLQVLPSQVCKELGLCVFGKEYVNNLFR